MEERLQVHSSPGPISVNGDSYRRVRIFLLTPKQASRGKGNVKIDLRTRTGESHFWAVEAREKAGWTQVQPAFEFLGFR
jgi:hypothetical protein